MDSDVETVRRTAALARLEITDEEAERLGPQFARILAAFRVLASLDVEGAEAMTHASGEESVLRADEERPSLPVDAALSNAPRRVDDFYGVPKTIGGDG